MSFLSFLKKEEKISLLIDIGNGAVTSALVSFTKNNKPEFLYSTTRSFSVLERPDPLRLSEGLLALLDSLLSSTVKKAGRLSSVVVSFSAPWFVLKTKNVHLENNAPFVITKSFLADIVSKEADSLEGELSKSLGTGSNASFEVTEKSIIHGTINGYQVEDFIGRKAKILDVSVFMSVIAKNIEEKVTDTISKHTHIARNKIFLHPFPLVLFSVVRDELEKNQDFILMDITSELTDISLVVNNTIVKNISFPFGRNSIIRQISKVLNLSLEIAESELNMYVNSKLDDSGVNLIRAILVDLEREWSIYLEDSLLSLSPNLTLPSSLYITANNDVTFVFTDFLKLTKTDVTGDFRKSLNIIKINKEVLAPFYKTNSKIGENEFIILLALFHDKLFKNQ